MSVVNLIDHVMDAVRTFQPLVDIMPSDRRWLFWEWAPASTEEELAAGDPSAMFPYITCMLILDDLENHWGMEAGTFHFHIYTFGDNGRECMEIRQKLSAALQRRFYEEPEGIRCLRIWKRRDGDIDSSISTKHEKVWLRKMRFGVRFWDQTLVEDVNDRVQDLGF